MPVVFFKSIYQEFPYFFQTLTKETPNPRVKMFSNI